MKNWQISFWTPGNQPADNGAIFGCSSYGISAPRRWNSATEKAAVSWPRGGVAARITGEAYGGFYGEVLKNLRVMAWKPAAAVLFFAHANGMESFLCDWRAIFPEVPTVGGGAARDGKLMRGEMLPAAQDVAVLLIAGGKWKAESLNIHDFPACQVDFRRAGPRRITWIRRSGTQKWLPATGFLRNWQQEAGRAPEDCESLTFSDSTGRNIHVSVDGADLLCGANLPDDGGLFCRTVSRTDATARLAEFCNRPGALVCGCAGLRSLLDKPLPAAKGTVSGFLFGEIVTLADGPVFGNLMAARLVPLA